MKLIKLRQSISLRVNKQISNDYVILSTTDCMTLNIWVLVMGTKYEPAYQFMNYLKCHLAYTSSNWNTGIWDFSIYLTEIKFKKNILNYLLLLSQSLPVYKIRISLYSSSGPVMASLQYFSSAKHICLFL